MTAATSGIWVVAERPFGLLDELVRIDPATNRIAKRVQIGLVGNAVAVGAGAIWVLNESGACVEYHCTTEFPPAGPGFPEENSVYRIDPNSGRVGARIALDAPGAIIVGEGAVWVTSSRKLYRIDPRTNRVTATTALPSEGPYGPYLIPAFGAGSLWVCAPLSTPGQPSSTVVYRINPSNNAVVATINIAMGPCGAITVAGNAVWVVPSGESRTVMQIDPLSNRVARELPYSSTSVARSIAVVGRDIWLGTDRGLLHLDQETGVVEQRSSVSGVVAADSSGIWVGTSGEILRFPTT
jgi:ligand-binding sensor domain-containing protein